MRSARTLILGILLLPCALGAGDAPSPRALTANGFPADEKFFPLAVWVQSPRNAERYHDLGINTYVALYRGPTAEQLDALDKAGIVAITHQNDAAMNSRERKTITGWMHG